MLSCEQIKAVFEQEFGWRYNIELQGGAEEPLYLPAEDRANQLLYTRDYPASALHEIAHWCLATEEQLKLKDWGHWYAPDGRTAEQQQRFQRAEARVQAVEWALSIAAGHRFRESTDNLDGEYIDSTEFKNQIHDHVLRFCERGLPERAAQLCHAFARRRRQPLVLSPALFARETLNPS